MSLDVARGRCRQRDSPCGDIKVWDQRDSPRGDTHGGEL